MSGAVGLAWADVYKVEAPALRIHGRKTESTHECRRFLQTKVRERVRKGESRAQLREYLEEAKTTGFALKNIEKVAKNDPKLASWEIGEVLAELFLEETEKVVFPWPPSWDKRTASASLPGPDLVGMHGDEGSEEFVFGEAKTSDAKDVHSSVMYGDDGLRKQIEELLESEERRQTLIGWLCVRAKDKPWRPAFDRCLGAYFSKKPRALVVGVLLRGVGSDEAHFAPVRTLVQATTRRFPVLLVGYYVPTPSEDWPGALEGSEERP